MPRRKKITSELQTRSLDSIGFYSDCQKKDMLFAKLIRSPAETVKITGISIPDLPENCFLLTADDIPGKKVLSFNNTNTKVFGYDRIMYAGEPIGIVVAPTEKLACELCKKAVITFDIVTMESALKQVMQNKIKITHDIKNSTDSDISDYLTTINELPALNNVYDKKNFVPVSNKKIAQRELKAGLFLDKTQNEVYEEIKTNEDIFVNGKWEEKLSNPYWQETNGAFAYMENGELHIYAPTKWTYYLHKTISEVLDIPEEKVFVHKTITSELKSSGLWRTTQLATQVAIAAFLIGKPVKLVLSHAEEDKYFYAGVNALFSYKSLVSQKTGIIKAMEVYIDIDVGSANPFAQEITDRMAIASCNYYTPQNIYIKSVAHTSKKPPTSICIKGVDSQAFFAIENHMEQIASKIEIPLPAECTEKELAAIIGNRDENNFQYFKVMQDNGICKYVVIDKEKFDVRLINSGSEDFPLQLNMGNISETIFTVKKLSDFDRKNVAFRRDAENRMNSNKNSFFALPLRGIGLATAYNNSGYLGTSTIPFDPKMEATLTANNCVVIHTKKPSESIKSIWRNIISSTLQLKPEAGTNKDIIEIDSDFTLDELPKTPEDANNFISIRNELLKKCCNDIKKKHFQQPLPIIAKKSLPKVSKRIWNNETFTGNPFFNTGFAAAVVEVELDLYTYSEKIKNIWVAIECGEILNEQAARKTISLEIQQELTSLVDGKTVICENFNITFIKSKRKPCQINKLIHNIIPAAFSSALSLALTTSLTTIPCTEEKLFQLVQKLSKQQENKLKASDKDRKKEDKQNDN